MNHLELRCFKPRHGKHGQLARRCLLSTALTADTRHCGPPHGRVNLGVTQRLSRADRQNPMRAGKRGKLSAQLRARGTGQAAAPALKANAHAPQEALSRRRAVGLASVWGERLPRGGDRARTPFARAATAGSGSDCVGYPHVHVPSCHPRRPRGEHGQRPDLGFRAPWRNGSSRTRGWGTGRALRACGPAGKEVLRHERWAVKGLRATASTWSGKTWQERDQTQSSAREPTATRTSKRVSPRRTPRGLRTRSRGWQRPSRSRTAGHRGGGGGGQCCLHDLLSLILTVRVSSSVSQNLADSKERLDSMPRANGCRGSAGAGGSRRRCPGQQGPQSTGRWKSPRPLLFTRPCHSAARPVPSSHRGPASPEGLGLAASHHIAFSVPAGPS